MKKKEREEKKKGFCRLRPNIYGFVVPAKEAEEGLFEGPIGPVITQNVFVVLHVVRQLPKRQERVAFWSVTVAEVLLHGLFGLCKREGFISFSGFALHHAFGMNTVHEVRYCDTMRGVERLVKILMI